MKNLSFILLAFGLILYSCDTTSDDGNPTEDGLLKDFIRLEARLQVSQCDMLRIHPAVPDMMIQNDLNIYFDSRDGAVNIDQDGNELTVDFDDIGFAGDTIIGIMKANLSQVGNSFKLDFEVERLNKSSVIEEYSSFAVSEMSHSSDQIIADVSTYRYLEFELDGTDVCNKLQNSTNPYNTDNPAYYWNSFFSFKDELDKCDCQNGGNLKITFVFDVAG